MDNRAITNAMLSIKIAGDPETISLAQALWREYWSEFNLPARFQGFEEELQALPGKYAPPEGTLAVAFEGEVPVGTVALRPLRMGACEVKRLYVRPPFRGRGIGHRLMEWIIAYARHLGYSKMYGDTLPEMAKAIEMYRELGFQSTDSPYSDDPTPGAIYLELRL